MSEPPPTALSVYLWISARIAWPLRLLLHRRARRGKEDPARLGEREGFGAARPAKGPVIWAHGASVGETTTLIGLLDALVQHRPDLGGVLTTGTVTAARLAAERLPAGFVHRYAPLDSLPWIERFLGGWQPSLALRVDSEIWPATLHALGGRRVPVLLLNGRLSAGSARQWARIPALARYLATRFIAIGAQDTASAERFLGMGASPASVSVLGSLKAAAPPLPVDAAALATLQAQIGLRPVWLAASLHPDEDVPVLTAAQKASEQVPNLLTLIVPRHPERGPALAEAAAAAGLTVARRSAGQGIAGEAVFVADTLGEMGLWYRLAPIAFIGGTLQSMGGHNPYEPAALAVALAAGPSRANFEEPYAALDTAQACTPIETTDDLAAFVVDAFDGEGTLTAEMERRGARAAEVLAIDRRPLEAAVALVCAHLPAP